MLLGLCLLAVVGIFVLAGMLEKPVGTSLVVLLVGGFGVVIWRLNKRERERQRAEHWAYLTGNYGEEAAQYILNGELWIGGCTIAMLKEILGEPDDIDSKILKTKSKYTYKYNRTGANRYGLRVFIEDDEVVGWEDKSPVG